MQRYGKPFWLTVSSSKMVTEWQWHQQVVCLHSAWTDNPRSKLSSKLISAYRCMDFSSYFQAGSESRSVGLGLSRRPPSGGQAPLAALRGSLGLDSCPAWQVCIYMTCCGRALCLDLLNEYYYYYYYYYYYASTSLLDFHGPDAPPGVQLTVSKHWRLFRTIESSSASCVLSMLYVRVRWCGWRLDRGILMTFGSGAYGCLGHGNCNDISQVCLHVLSSLSVCMWAMLFESVLELATVFGKPLIIPAMFHVLSQIFLSPDKIPKGGTFNFF